MAKLAGASLQGAWKHVQKISRPSPPCPRNPCPRLLLICSASEAANLSSQRDPLQVQLDRRCQLGGFCAAVAASWPPSARVDRAAVARRCSWLAAGLAAQASRHAQARRSRCWAAAGGRERRASRALSAALSRASRRCSGAAAAARPQRASRARWRRIGRLRCWGEAHAARDGRWAPWAVATAVLRLCMCYLVCWYPEGVAPCVKVGLF